VEQRQDYCFDSFSLYTRKTENIDDLDQRPVDTRSGDTVTER